VAAALDEIGRLLAADAVKPLISEELSLLRRRGISTSTRVV
jgi:hypothetical protein